MPKFGPKLVHYIAMLEKLLAVKAWRKGVSRQKTQYSTLNKTVCCDDIEHRAKIAGTVRHCISMPHNNFWSLDSEQTSSRGLPSCREGNLASWGSESDGSNHTAAISLHPCSSVSSSHGQNQNHAHPCDRKKQQKHDQPSLQQLQVKHSQIIPKQQQQYLSNTHGQDKKLIYATSDHQQDKSLSVGINGNGNYMRASNSSTKTFPNNQNFIVTAGQTMQNNRKGILYLGYQNMDSPSEKGSYTPEPDVGQQQKPHVQQQHQQLATTNLSQGLQSSTSLDEACTEGLWEARIVTGSQTTGFPAYTFIIYSTRGMKLKIIEGPLPARAARSH
ncbi:hypothetical protein RRG08_014769 [Elysia crispata]|uniref:Uncharacterized protein n=1 Tax=Elysia crispata TaxID=231223 RepID=A0AAE1AW02_9GAST|nr:hypothetical protein RRG08_014769 [Elysia crispata]